MKEFDLNKIGRQMPYDSPGDKFFEEFTEQMLARVAQEQEPRKVFSLKRVLIPTLSVAAALAVILTVIFNVEKSSEWSTEYIISENLDESIDSFFNSLSDEDLEYLALQSSYNEDFFANLPD